MNQPYFLLLRARRERRADAAGDLVAIGLTAEYDVKRWLWLTVLGTAAARLGGST